jgi:hypothetical protein
MFTDFKETKLKRKKIKLLIEEIPHIHQLRKGFYSLYKARKCPMCSIEEETFNHIWICNSRSLEMLNLISKFKEELITIINDNILENYNNIGKFFRVQICAGLRFYNFCAFF